MCDVNKANEGLAEEENEDLFEEKTPKITAAFALYSTYAKIRAPSRSNRSTDSNLHQAVANDPKFPPKLG